MPEPQGQDAARQTKSQQRFLSEDAARRNGVYDYFGMMLLTGASDQDPVGNNSIGFTRGLTSRGDKVQVLDVDSALGFLPDGSYRALPQTVTAARAQIRTMIDELRSAGVFRRMSWQDQANSVNNALHGLRTQDIVDAVNQFRGKIPESQLNEIRQGLLARREALAELFEGRQNVAPRTANAIASRRRYATSLSDVRLSPEHERLWSLPRRFAQPRRLLRRMAWGVFTAATRTAIPDANYYPDPSPLTMNVRHGVQVKELDRGPTARFAATASALGLAGLGYLASRLSSSYSDYFSMGRGFLNIFKLQAKIRTVALAAVRRQTDIPTLIAELQHYHVGIEHTLDGWTQRRYNRYLTVSGDAREQLRVATENLLGRLARIPPETPDAETKKQVAVLLSELFAAHNKIMGVNTANLHFFSQASNAGAALQLGLVLGYTGSIAIDVRGFIAEGVPRGLQWLATAPEYINDLGKIGSLLNAASATWGRLSEKFPFSPNKSATLTKLAKLLEPYGNLLQGTGNFLEAAIGLANLQALESPVQDIKAAFKFLASWGYTKRGLEHWRKGSAEEQARAAAASSTGSAGEIDTGEVVDLVKEIIGEGL